MEKIKEETVKTFAIIKICKICLILKITIYYKTYMTYIVYSIFTNLTRKFIHLLHGKRNKFWDNLNNKFPICFDYPCIYILKQEYFINRFNHERVLPEYYGITKFTVLV